MIGQTQHKSRILLMTGIVLTSITLLVGVTVFVVMERHAKAQHIQNLTLSLKGTSQLIETEIESVYKASLLISKRPTLIRFLEAFTTTNHSIDVQTTLNKTAPSFFEEGVSAIALFDEDGLRLSNSGIFSQQPELTVMLSDFPAEVRLIWDRKLLLSITLEVRKEGRIIGKIMTETPLPNIMKAFKDARLLGETGELMLCASMDFEMGCFPSTLNPNILMMPQMRDKDRMVSMAPSLSGESGYTDSIMDYRKQIVSAAYGPVGYYGLGVMLKVDMAELNGPLWTQLSYLIPLIVTLIMISLIFMRWRVAPMVLELTDSVNHLNQLNKEKDQQTEDLTHLIEEKDKRAEELVIANIAKDKQAYQLSIAHNELTLQSERNIIRQEADKAKSEFISTVSHELRTPLTAIKGALGLMQAGVFDRSPERLPAIVSMAFKNTDRLHHLIDDILDIERLNVGKMNFQMGSVDVSLLLEEAALSIESYGSQYGVTFVYSGADELLYVNGDHHRLIQVMSNLLSNAAKFSHRDGQVDVSLARHNGSIRVSVQDYGRGIPESARASIFDDFTQVDSSDQRNKGGSGLGLGIAKKIVEAHGGQINFISEVDKGTTFYFDLPEFTTSQA
jgi:signal transduction histidine kinase